jgi:hypothetical protein
MPFQQLEDKVLMSEFLFAGASKEELLSLNLCRLHLRAYFLSDITNGYGTLITDDAWMGRYQPLSWPSSWPKQAPPLRHDWTIWRKFIKSCFLSRGMKLQQPLGAWIQHDVKWPWYYSTDTDCLYHNSEGGCKEFSRVPHCSNRMIFMNLGASTEVVPKLYRATVYPKGQRWICSGFDGILTITTPSRHTFTEFLVGLPPTERWCMDHLLMDDNGFTIVQALQNREAIAVSDGSFKNEYGTAAWVIEGADSHGRILGQVIAPGGPSDHSPYRSELTGIYSIMIMVNRLCEFYDIKEGENELACDGLSALDK